MKRENKFNLIIGGVIGVLVLMSFLGAINNLNDDPALAVMDSKDSRDVFGELKTSADFEETAITIDDSATGVGAHNWSWAVAQEWCGGSGTEGDPFLIENVTINGLNSSSCLSISNSNATTYVTINSCTFTNSSVAGAGLYLDQVSNITVTDCTLENNNGHGIYVNGTDCTFYGNTFTSNLVNAEDDDELSGNTWDNGVDSGNTWDDYSGVDKNDNGLGDTPYSITGDASAQDNYPIFSDGIDIIVGGGDSDGGDRDLWEEVYPTEDMIVVAGQYFCIAMLCAFFILFKTKRLYLKINK